MAIKISKNRVDMGSTPIKNVQYQDLDQITTPAAPATGKTRFYSKSGGGLFVVPAAGSETAIIPANLIAHTTDATAPTGWTEYVAGRGRVIVGTPLSGTAGGTVGTAMTNLQDVGQHTHTGPSHSHNYVVGGYNVGLGEYANYYLNTPGSDGSGQPRIGNPGGPGGYQVTGGAAAAGTGATGATSATMPYVQLLGIQKS